MKTVLSFCSMIWLAASVAQAQFVVDCACLAQQPGLHVTNCTATIPDLCAIVTNCFRGTVVPPPPIPSFQCSQTPTAGTIVGPGVYGIMVTVQIPGVPPSQCLVPFQVIAPNAGQFTLQCAPNKTVNCDAQWGFDPPTSVNPCCPNAAQPNGGVVISVVSTVTNGTCPQVITRTWQGVDNCGQTATCSQTVTVVDNVAPTITCGPNQTVNCGQQWSFSTPTISDNCTAPSDLVLSIVSTTSAGSCPEVITRVWQVTDLCGNKTLCTETVTIQDLIPPTITCAPNKSVPCGTQWGFDPPTATDNCSSAAGTPSVTIAVVSTVTNSFCPLVVTRTWSATDACGNSSQCSQTVTVGGPGGLTLNCATLAALPELQTNACDGFVPALCARALALAQQNCLCPLTCTQSPAPGTQYGPGTYPITITVSDGAGGTATCTVNFVVTAPPGGCNTNCVPPPPNMVAWWPLDELNGATFFSDLSGNGNTAIVESGGPLGSPQSPTAAAGMVAGSSYFIDNSTRGRAPNSGTLNFSSGSFSMDCWFWPVDQGPFNRWQPMIDKFHPGTLLGYMIGITNYISGPNNFGRVAITVGDGAASTYYSVATVNFFAWNFVGIIVDRAANTVRFNINGVLEAPIPLTLGGSINNSLDLLIGATQVGLNVTEMRLDEIELFDRALNPSELADIWTANTLGKCKTNCLPQTRVWNTGASGGTLLAPGTPDPNYVLVSAPPGGCTGPAQVLNPATLPVPPWVANGPNSQWIGAGPTADCQEGVYHYQICFYLPCTDGASVIGQWAADDNAAMSLNGQPTGNTIPSPQNPNLPLYGWFPVAISNGFVCGINCLDFYVTNANIGINPTGFRAELTNVFNDCCICTNIVNCACDFVNGDFSTFVPVNGTGGGWTSYDLFAGAGWQGAGGNPGGTFLLNNVGDPSTDPTIAQQLCCLTPGQCYTIRGQRKVQAWFQQTQPSFAVLVDGAPILILPVPSNPADANWYPFTASFTATNKCQTIAFAAEYAGSDVSYWIDNITLECCKTNPCSLSITCPPDINRDICGPQEIITYPLPVASSSCGLAIVSVICNPPSGSLFNLGATTVNCVATDAQGNTAACSFTVTLRRDTTPPVINCTCVQAAIPPRVNACSYTVPDLCQLQNCFSDNCTPPGQLTCTQSPPAGTVLPAGSSYIITLTVTDAAGNVSAPCQVGVSVIAPTDTRVWNTGGSGSQAANFTVIQTPGGPANIPAVLTQPATGFWLPNDANSSWVSFTPNSQNAAPGVYIYRLTFNIPCTNGASIAGRFMSDDAARIWLNGVPTTALSTSFSTWTPVSLTSGFVPGVNTLDIYVTNATIWTGLRTELTNTFTCCCPQSIVLNCPRPQSAWVCAPNAVAPVPYTVTASSVCSPNVTVTCVPPSPGPFPVGTTMVNCTATDSLGNTTSCSFPVTVVRDIIPPVITCPGPITRVLCANSVAVYYKPKAKDDCSPTVGITCVPPSGTVFNVGTTIVTCTATDACGNSASCSFPVTVINNTIWQLLPSGINDCYAQSGFEPNSPGACLITAYGAGSWKNYDVSTVNRKVGHTWTFPPPWNILGAQLATRARPPVGSCAGISDNDSFSLGLINCTTPAWLWSRYLGSGNASPGLINRQWCYASGTACDHLFNLNLAALPLTPSGTVSLLPHMNSADRLDLFFQDDTTVDFANLRIQRCPPTHVIGGIGTEILNARIAYGPAIWCLIRDNPATPAANALFRIGEAEGLRLPIEPLVLADHPGSVLALGEEQDGVPVEWLRAELQEDGNVRVSLGELPPGVTHIDMEVEIDGEIVQSFSDLPATAGMPLADFPGTEPVVELATANGNELLASILSQEPDEPDVKQTLRVRHLRRAKVNEAVVNVRVSRVPEIGIGQPELQAILRESPTRPTKVHFAGTDDGLLEVSGGQLVISPLHHGNEAGTMKEGKLRFPPTDEFRAMIPPPFGMFGPVPSNAVFSTIVRGIIDQDDDGDGVSTQEEGDVDVARFVAHPDGIYTFDFTWSSARVHPSRKIYYIAGPAGLARLEFPGNSNVVVNLAELPVMHGKLGGRTPCRRFNWPKPTSLRIGNQSFEATELRVLVETDNYPVTALTGLRLEAEGAESLMVSGLGVGPEVYRLDIPELTPDGVFLRWSGFGGLLEEATDVLGPWAPTPGQFEQSQGEVLTPLDPAARLKVFRVRGQ